MEHKRIELLKLSESYFSLLAKSYPVICLSDEFYFFPRAKKAIKYLGGLDCLNRDKIKQDISRIKSFEHKLEKINLERADLETRIDAQLLKQNIRAFLQAFQELKIWQHNPNLYLKIIFLGIEQLVKKIPMAEADYRDNLYSRLKQIPLLLSEAKINLKQIPSAYRETSMQMIKSGSAYLKTEFSGLLKRKGLIKELKNLTIRCLKSLEDFKKFIAHNSCEKNIINGRGLLEETLSEVFGYKRSLKEIFEIACEEYRRTKIQLRNIARGISPNRDWKWLLSKYKLKVVDSKELLRLYSGQIMDLKNFFIKKDIFTIPEMQDIKTEQTPVYINPVRASASYSCPLTTDRREAAFFYVSIYSGKNKPTQKGNWANIHQEYIFVTAHETYPGHHLLDSIRRNLKNPIRQQIESPLFYEGWAFYAERFIDSLGYIKDPRQRLIGLRRQAWRAIRAKLDAGLRIKKITLPQAAHQLRLLGYSPSVVDNMLKHYVVTPGYQLCYTIGKFEIEKLRDKFASRMGIKNFHDCLLRGGQIPFHLIRKRMERICTRNS